MTNKTTALKRREGLAEELGVPETYVRYAEEYLRRGGTVESVAKTCKIPTPTAYKIAKHPVVRQLIAERIGTSLDDLRLTAIEVLLQQLEGGELTAKQKSELAVKVLQSVSGASGPNGIGGRGFGPKNGVTISLNLNSDDSPDLTRTARNVIEINDLQSESKGDESIGTRDALQQDASSRHYGPGRNPSNDVLGADEGSSKSGHSDIGTSTSRKIPARKTPTSRKLPT